MGAFFTEHVRRAPTWVWQLLMIVVSIALYIMAFRLIPWMNAPVEHNHPGHHKQPAGRFTKAGGVLALQPFDGTSAHRSPTRAELLGGPADENSALDEPGQSRPNSHGAACGHVVAGRDTTTAEATERLRDSIEAPKLRSPDTNTLLDRTDTDWSNSRRTRQW